MKELREQCLYLHFDGARYTFKTTPNVTKLIEDEAQIINPERDIKPLVREELNKRLAGEANAIVWPDGVQIPDEESTFLTAYLPIEFAQLKEANQEEKASLFFTKTGNKPRKYRNGLGLVIPNRDQLEPLSHSARYVLAIERV